MWACIILEKKMKGVPIQPPTPLVTFTVIVIPKPPATMYVSILHSVVNSESQSFVIIHVDYKMRFVCVLHDVLIQLSNLKTSCKNFHVVCNSSINNFCFSKLNISFPVWFLWIILWVSWNSYTHLEVILSMRGWGPPSWDAWALKCEMRSANKHILGHQQEYLWWKFQSGKFNFHKVLKDNRV